MHGLFVFQHFFEHLTTLKTIHWFGLFLINSIEELFGLLSFSKYFVKNVIGSAKHYLQVVSVQLFWFYSMSFSYNGEYFLRFIFNCTLGQYPSVHSFWAKFWSAKSNFLSLTLCSFVSNTYIYMQKFLSHFQSGIQF